MKRKMLSVLLCAAMMGTTLAGATSVLAADDKDSDSKWEYKEATLTFLIDPDTASSGYQAVLISARKRQVSTLRQSFVHQAVTETTR